MSKQQPMDAPTDAPEFRIEHDSLGTVRVPQTAYYGGQTQRARENFSISGVLISHYPELIRALVMVKHAAATANLATDQLEQAKAAAIQKACDEIISGELHDQFVVDMVQGGAGTSTNMNANEVIANRALELMGFAKGDYVHLHPNNDVNMSQSTNDVYPSAARLAIVFAATGLNESIAMLESALLDKAREFSDVLKVGRTQLQDAVPMTLGQEFEAFAVTLQEDIDRIREICLLLCQLNLGGTAVGTGINTHPDYRGRAIQALADISRLPVVSALNLIEATSDMGAFVLFSGMLKRLAVKLSKIANDLRLLSSGPRAGLGEINLPPAQPGSSIMPGKVNPVIPEAVNQTAFHVIGNDLAITMAAEAGQLQLNAMEPLIVFKTLQSINMLAAAMNMLSTRCIAGITVNREHCRRQVESSAGLATALTPYIGYDLASEIAKEALRTGRSVVSLIVEKNILDREQIDRILDPENMVAPNVRSQH